MHCIACTGNANSPTETDSEPAHQPWMGRPTYTDALHFVSKVEPGAFLHRPRSLVLPSQAPLSWVIKATWGRPGRAGRRRCCCGVGIWEWRPVLPCPAVPWSRWTLRRIRLQRDGVSDFGGWGARQRNRAPSGGSCARAPARSTPRPRAVRPVSSRDYQ